VEDSVTIEAFSDWFRHCGDKPKPIQIKTYTNTPQFVAGMKTAQIMEEVEAVLIVVEVEAALIVKETAISGFSRCEAMAVNLM